MRYPNQEKLNPADLWRWCNYRADTVVCSEQIEADQHGWRQAADLLYARGVELAEATNTIERLQKMADERGESFARSIDDFNNMRDQRDAALAEVERLRAENAIKLLRIESLGERS